ncbi:Conserved hypothetical protein (transglutaminase?) [Mycobacteroides abscessus]|nr:Conserved hypothetical protein (transglutaminase?) [Mycobacteroides abscessus]
MTVDHSPYLEPTEFLDWQQDSVRDFVSSAIRGACGDTEKAIAIVTAVRDSIWYDPYTVTDNPHAYRASTVATAERAYCVPKAVLLTAACRAAGIPARLGLPTSETTSRPRHCASGWGVATFSSTTATVSCSSTVRG